MRGVAKGGGPGGLEELARVRLAVGGVGEVAGAPAEEGPPGGGAGKEERSASSAVRSMTSGVAARLHLGRGEVTGPVPTGVAGGTRAGGGVNAPSSRDPCCCAMPRVRVRVPMERVRDGP